MKPRIVFYRYWPILFIVLIWLIFCSPYIVKGLIPFPSKYLVSFFPPWNASYAMPVKNNAISDVITQLYPWKLVTIDSWKNNEVPLWNPYSFSGTAHAANYQTAVFSPINLIFYLFSFIDAWSIAILLQPLVAGISMYLLIRSYKLAPIYSLYGSISFMFCGFIVVWMAYGTLGYAISVLPLILFGIHNYSLSHKWYDGVLVSLAIQFSLLSGHFQISSYVLLVLAIFTIFDFYIFKNIYIFVNQICYIFLGIALAAPQILLTYDAYTSSVRASSFGSGEIIPWQYLITLLAPDFFGNPVTRNDWFGHYAEWSGYIGAVPLLFSVYGFYRKKSETEALLWVLAITSLLFATPSFLNTILYKTSIPVLATSAASRIIVITSFSLSFLAAFGLRHVYRDWQLSDSRPYLKFVYSIVVFLVIVWIFLIINPFLGDKVSIARRNFFLPTAFMMVAVFGLVMGKLPALRKSILFIFLLLSAAEMLRFTMKWMPFDPKEYIYPSLPIATELQKSKISRVFGNIGNEFTTTFHIPSIEGYDAVYQKRYGELIAAASNAKMGELSRSVVLLDKFGVGSEQLMQLLGVRYVLHRISDGENVWAYPIWQFPHYRKVYRGDHYEIFENQHVLPRTYLASSYKVGANDQNVLDYIFDDDSDLRDLVILEESPYLDPTKGNGNVEFLYYKSSNVVLKSISEVPKLLFLSDSYEKGWRAAIDNVDTHIYRANYAFRVIAVPPGEHKIVFNYDPISFRFGLAVAGVSYGVLLIIKFKNLYENRNI